MPALSDAIVRKGLAKPWHIIACVPQHLDAIAADQGVELPLPYRELMLEIGCAAGNLFHSVAFHYPDVLGIKRDAEELLEFNGCSELLSPDALVISMCGGCQFHFCRTSVEGDPMVYLYMEGNAGVTPRCRISAFGWLAVETWGQPA